MQTVATPDSTAFANDVITRIADHYDHILLPADVSHAVLDGIATGLAALHGRVLRPSTSNALTLPGLLAQIAGVPDAALDALVPLHSRFDCLGVSGIERGQVGVGHLDGDAPGRIGLA